MSTSTLTTLIEFVNAEGGGGGGGTAQTGDFLFAFIAILACAFVLLGGFYIISRELRMTQQGVVGASNKSSVLQNAFSNTRTKVVICATALVCFLTIIFSSMIVVNAFASSDVTVPDKITAKVNATAGTIEVENGYLKNDGAIDIKINNASSETTETSREVAGIETMSLTIAPATATDTYLFNGHIGEGMQPTYTDVFKKDTSTVITYKMTPGNVDLKALIGTTIKTDLTYEEHLFTLAFGVNDKTRGVIDNPEPIAVPEGTKYDLTGDDNQTLNIYKNDGSILKSVTATAIPPYKFSEWIADVVWSGTVTSDINFEAEFTEPGSIVINFVTSDPDKGDVLNSQDEIAEPIEVSVGATYYVDEQGNLHIIDGETEYIYYGYASHGNVFDDWKANGESSTSGTITENTEFTGVFIINKYTISFAASEGGKVDPDTTLTQVPYNTLYKVKGNVITIDPYDGHPDAQTITASAINDNYEFSHWENNGRKIEDGTKAVVADMELTAVYKLKTLEINFETADATQGKPERWTISDIPINSKYRVMADGTIQFNWGDHTGVINVMAYAFEGYQFDYWTGKDNPTAQESDPIEIGWEYDLGTTRIFTVYFKQSISPKFTVYFDSDNETVGTVSQSTLDTDKGSTYKIAADGSVNINGNKVVTIDILDTNYEFDYWTVNDTKSTSGTIDSNHQFFRCYFKQKEVTINLMNIDGHGSAFPVKVAKVAAGSQVDIDQNGTLYFENGKQVNVYPNEGYQYAEWQNAEGVPLESSFTVDADDTTWAVFFKEKSQGLIVPFATKPSDGGTVSEKLLTGVPEGSTYVAWQNYLVVNGTTIEATAASGYVFKYWEYKDSPITDIEYGHITDSSVFYAVFEYSPNSYKVTVSVDDFTKGKIVEENGAATTINVPADTPFKISNEKLTIGTSYSYSAKPVQEGLYYFLNWQEYGTTYSGKITQDTNFEALFDAHIYTLTFKGEEYMDLFDADISTTSPKEEITAEVYAGTKYSDPALESGNSSFFDFLSAYPTFNKGEAIRFTDIKGKQHTIYAKPKYAYGAILHFDSWSSDPKTEAGMDIRDNIIFTPSLLRNQYTVTIDLDDDEISQTYGDLDYADRPSEKEEGWNQVSVPYGSQVYVEDNKIYIYDSLREELYEGFKCFVNSETNKYHFDSWDTSELKTDGSGTYVGGDCTIYGKIAINSYTVTLTAWSHGQIDVYGGGEATIEVPHGTSINWSTLNSEIIIGQDTSMWWGASAIAKDTGYEFSRWECVAYDDDWQILPLENDTVITSNLAFRAYFTQGINNIFVGVSGEAVVNPSKLAVNANAEGGSTELHPDYIDFVRVYNGVTTPIAESGIAVAVAKDIDDKARPERSYYSYGIKDGWNVTSIYGYLADPISGQIDENASLIVFKSRINPTNTYAKSMYSLTGWTDNDQDIGTFGEKETIKDRHTYLTNYRYAEYTITINVSDDTLYRPASAPNQEGAITEDKGRTKVRTLTYKYKREATIAFLGDQEHTGEGVNPYLYILSAPNELESTVNYSEEKLKTQYNNFVSWDVVSSLSPARMIWDEYTIDSDTGYCYRVSAGDVTINATFDEITSTITYTSLDKDYDTYFGYISQSSTDTVGTESVTETIHKYTGTPEGLTGAYAVGSNFDELCEWTDDEGNVVKSIATGTASNVDDLRHYVPSDTTNEENKIWYDKTYYVSFVPALALFDDSTSTMTFTCQRDAEIGYPDAYIFPVYSTTAVRDVEKLNDAKVHYFPSWMYKDGTWKVHPIKIKFASSFYNFKSLTGTANWFNAFDEWRDNYKLKSIEGLSNLYTGNVTDMTAMFQGVNPHTSYNPILQSTNPFAAIANFVSELFIDDSYPVTGGMSMNDYGVTSIDISSWDSSKVESVSNMFAYQTSLADVSLPVAQAFWNACTNYREMFKDCISLPDLTIANYVSSKQNYFGCNAEDMANMYEGCSFASVNISSTLFGSEATDMSYMFNGCSYLESFTIASTSYFGRYAQDLSYMFADCNLKEVDFKDNVLGRVATNTASMFKSNYNLSKVYIDNFFIGSSDSIKTENMFLGCDKNAYGSGICLISIGQGVYNNKLKLSDLGISSNRWYHNGQEPSALPQQIPSSLDDCGIWTLQCAKAIYDSRTSELTFVGGHELVNDPKLKVYYLSNDNYGYYAKDSRSTFKSNVGLGEFHGDDIVLPPWYTRIDENTIQLTAPAQKVIFDSSFASYLPNTLSCWFMADSYGTSAFTHFYSKVGNNLVPGFQNLNTCRVSSCASMFGGFSNYLADGGSALSTKDTFNTNLTEIDISTLNIADSDYDNQFNLAGMFANCSALKKIKLPEGIENARSLQALFYNCSSLVSTQDITNFEKANIVVKVGNSFVSDKVNPCVTEMFAGCSSLEYLDLSKWYVDVNTHPYSTQDIFESCESLATLKIAGGKQGEDIGWYKNMEDGNTALPYDDKNLWYWQDSPKEDKYFNPWQIPNEEMLNYNKTITLTRNPAFFNTYTVSVITGSYGGSISPNPTAMDYVNNMQYGVNGTTLCLQDSQFMAQAYQGYQFKYWSLNGQRIDNLTNAYISENAVFAAYFEPLQLTPKALYDEAHETLTFIYDNTSYEDIDGIQVFEINDDDVIPPWLDYNYQSFTRSGESYNWPYITTKVPKATTVRFEESFAAYDKLRSTSLWFAADTNGVQPYKNFVSVVNGSDTDGFRCLNTFSLNNVAYMFGGIFSVETDDNLSIYANPNNTYSHSLKTLDLSTFDLSHVKDWSYLLANCVALEKVTFQTKLVNPNVEKMTGMFANCENLKGDAKDVIINMDKFQTSNVIDFDYLFYGCSGLTKIDVSNFDTFKASQHWATYNGEYVLNYSIYLDYEHFNYIFYDCVRLSDITWKLDYKEDLDFVGNRKYTLNGWTFNFLNCGLENLPDASEKFSHWTLLYNTLNTNIVPGHTYWSLVFPYMWYAVAEGHESISTLIQDGLLSSGQIVREAPEENKVNFTVNDETCGTVNNQPSASYDFINSAQVTVDSVDTNVLYADNATYIARPKEGYTFKYWTLNGTPVTSDFIETYLASNYEEEATFVAVFESNVKTPKAVFTPEAGFSKATMTFVYDSEKYADKIVFDVIPNSSDYNWPTWYETLSSGWHSGDSHNVPKFVSAIEEGAKNGITVEFADSFAEYDSLRSMSCWFMSAVNSATEDSLFSPFIFDTNNFKGLKNINTSNLDNVKYMFGGHEYFNDYTGSKLTSTNKNINLTGFNTGGNGQNGSNEVTYEPLKNINGMFANCCNLERVTFGDKFVWDNITKASYLFYNCKTMINNPDLLENNLLKVKSDNFTDISYMFALYYEDDAVTEDVIIPEKTIFIPDSFKTDNVTNFAGLFSGHKDVVKLIVIARQDALSTASATNMSYLFANNTHMESFNMDDCANFDTSNVANMSYMFSNCSALSNTDDVAKYINSYRASNLSYMFADCTNLSSFDIQRPEYSWEIINSHYMFKDCVNLTRVNLSNFSFAFDSTQYSDPVSNMFYTTSTGGYNYSVNSIFISQNTFWNYNYTFNDLGLENTGRWSCSQPSQVAGGYKTADTIPTNDDSKWAWGNFVKGATSLTAQIKVNNTEKGYFESDNNLNEGNTLLLYNVVSSDIYTYEVPVALFTKEAAQTLKIETGIYVDEYGEFQALETYNIKAYAYDKNNFDKWTYDGTEITNNRTPIYVNTSTNIFSAEFTGLDPMVFYDVGYDSKQYKNIGILTFTTNYTADDLKEGAHKAAWNFYEDVVKTSEKPWGEGKKDPDGKLYSEMISAVTVDSSFENVTFNNAQNLFKGLKNLKGYWDMEECMSVWELHLEMLNLSNQTNVASMFEGCSSLEQVYFYEGVCDPYMDNAFDDCDSLEYIDFGGMAKVNTQTEEGTCLSKCDKFTSFTIGKGFQTEIHSLVDRTDTLPPIYSYWTSEDGTVFCSKDMPYACGAGTYTKQARRIQFNFYESEKWMFAGQLLINFTAGDTVSYEIKNDYEIVIYVQGKDGSVTTYDNNLVDCPYGKYVQWSHNGDVLEPTYGTKVVLKDEDFDDSGIYYIQPNFVNTKEDTLYVYAQELPESKSNDSYYQYVIKYGQIPEQPVPDQPKMWAFPYAPDWNSAFYRGDHLDSSQFANIYSYDDYHFVNPENVKKIVIDESVKNYHGLTSLDSFCWRMINLESIKDFENFDTRNVKSMQCCFADCRKLNEIGFSNLHMDSTINASSMFTNCINLTKIGFAKDNKTPNLINMDYMFFGCHNCQTLDLSTFDFSHVTTMNSMFSGLYDESSAWGKTHITWPAISDTSKVVNMSSMFADSRTDFNLNNLNTSGVVDMSNMFRYCYQTDFGNFSLASFDTSNVQNMNYMFNSFNLPNYERQLYSYVDLDLSSFNTANVKTMQGMFSDSYFASYNVSSFNTSSVNNMAYMFKGISQSLDNEINLDLRSFDITNCYYLYSMFAKSDQSRERSSNIHKIYVDSQKWIINSQAETEYMLNNCVKLEGQNGTTMADLEKFRLWVADGTYARIDKATSKTKEELAVNGGLLCTENTPKVVFRWYNAGDQQDAPEQLPSLSSIFGYHIDTDPIEMLITYDSHNYNNDDSDTVVYYVDSSTRKMVPAVFDIVNTDYADIRIPKVTAPWQNNDMESILMNTDYVTIDPSFINVKTALKSEDGTREDFTSIAGWFANMPTLQSVSGLQYIYNGVTDYRALMYNDHQLNQLNASGVVGQGAKDFSYMFTNCGSLEYIDLGGIDTSQVTTMEAMFKDSGIVNLDLRGMDTHAVTNMKEMFMNCSKLHKIYYDPEANEWSVSQIPEGQSNNMFAGCDVLRGQLGTSIKNNNPVDKTYARLDEDLKTKPGYFSIGENYAKAVHHNVDDKDVLTFYYDAKSHLHDANLVADDFGQSVYRIEDVGFDDYAYWNYDVFPTWINENWKPKLNPSKVVFDSSFKNFKYYDYGMSYGQEFDSMSCWFYSFTNLVDVEGWENVSIRKISPHFDYMFENCTNLKGTYNYTTKLWEFDMSGLENIENALVAYMFCNCPSLEVLNMGGFYSFMHTWDAPDNPKKYAFYNCSNLTTIYVNDEFGSYFVNESGQGQLYPFSGGSFIGQNMQVYDTFTNCVSLVGSQGTSYLQEYSDYGDEANGSYYAYIDGSDGEPGYLSAYNPLYWGIDAENTLYLSNDISLIPEAANPKLSLKAMNAKDSKDIDWHDKSITKATIVAEDGTQIRPYSLSYWFDGQANLQSIEGLENIATTNTTDLSYAFSGCSSVKELNLKFFETYNVDDMTSMFDGCSSLETIYATYGAWNTSSVAYSNKIFLDCDNLVGGCGTRADSYPEAQRTIDLAIIDEIEYGPDGQEFPYHGFLTEAPYGKAVYNEYNRTLTFVYDNIDYRIDKNTGLQLQEIQQYPIVYSPASLGIEGKGAAVYYAYPSFFGRIEGGCQAWNGLYGHDMSDIQEVIIDESFEGFKKYDYYPNVIWDDPGIAWLNDNYKMEYPGDELGLSNSFGKDFSNMDGWFSGLNWEYYDQSGNGYYPNVDTIQSKILFTGLDHICMDKVNSMVNTFSCLANPQFIDEAGIATLDTSNVVNMAQCFACDIFANGFDTKGLDVSKVENMMSMFYNTIVLSGSVDLNFENTSQLNNITSMFCEFIGNVKFSNFKIANVASTVSMFNHALIVNDKFSLDGLDTTNVRDMSCMFTGLSLVSPSIFNYIFGSPGLDFLDNLSEPLFGEEYYAPAGSSTSVVQEGILDLSNLKTTNVENMTSMFANLNDYQKNTSDRMSGLTSSNYFEELSKGQFIYPIRVLDLSSFYTSKVHIADFMFSGCNLLRTIYVDPEMWDFTAVDQMQQIFNDCRMLKGQRGTSYQDAELRLRDYALYARLDLGEDEPGYLSSFDERTAKAVAYYAEEPYDSELNDYSCENYSLHFVYDSYSYEAVDISEAMAGDVAAVYDIDVNSSVSMDSSVEPIVPGWLEAKDKADDESNGWVIGTKLDFRSVYFENGFEDVENINVGGTATKLTSVSGWFCSMGLGSIFGLDKIPQQITDMSCLFRGTTLFKQVLDVSSLYTNNVTNMEGMFAYFGGPAYINFGLFDTSKVENMKSMFESISASNNEDSENAYVGSSEIEMLNLSSFDISNVKNLDRMFANADTVMKIYVNSAWRVRDDASGEGMFYGCTQLSGQYGTHYPEARDDKAAAVIDTQTAEKGYLSNVPLSAKAVVTKDDTTSKTTMEFYYDTDTHLDDKGLITDSTGAPAIYALTSNCYSSVNPETLNLWIENMPSWFISNEPEISNGYLYGATPKVNPDIVKFDDSFKYFQKFYDEPARPTNNDEEANIRGDVVSEGAFRSIDCWFAGFTNLKEIQGWNNVCFGDSAFTMNATFLNCSLLPEIDMSAMNHYYLYSANSAFAGCATANTIDVSNVTDVSDKIILDSYTSYFANMFSWCNNLETIYTSDTLLSHDHVKTDFNSNDRFNAYAMFLNDHSLVGQCGTSYTDLFNQGYPPYVYESNLLANLDTYDQPGYFTLKSYLYYYLDGDTLYLSSSKVQDFYQNCSDILVDHDDSQIHWLGSDKITSIVINPASGGSDQEKIYPTSMKSWFKGLSNLTSIDGIENIDTTYLKDLTSTFEGCSSLGLLDLKYFNTAHVDYMDATFKGCSNLQKIYATIDAWVNTEVDSSVDMFKGCDVLEGSDGSTIAKYGKIDCTYAKVDQANEASPGYFSRAATAKAVGLCNKRDPKQTQMRFVYDDIDYNAWAKDDQKDWAVMRDKNEELAIYPITYSSYNDSLLFEEGSVTLGIGDLPPSEVTPSVTVPAWYKLGLVSQYIDEPHYNAKIPVDSIEIYPNFANFKYYDYVDDDNMFGKPVTNIDLWFSGFVGNSADNGAVSIKGLENIKFDIQSANAAFASSRFTSSINSQLENLNTSHMTSCTEMFSATHILADTESKLHSALDVAFDTSNVEDMTEMFFGLYANGINFSGKFSTAKVKYMNGMFMDYTPSESANKLDLTSFSTSSVEYNGGFNNVFSFNNGTRFDDTVEPQLETVYVDESYGKWDIYNRDIWGHDVFTGLTSIVGQGGFKYNPEKVIAKYAHINLKWGANGYLSEKLTLLNADAADEQLQHADVLGTVTFADPETDNHKQVMEAGLPVQFVYTKDGVDQAITTKTDAFGNYTLSVPVGLTGKIYFAYNGYEGSIENVTVPEEGLTDMDIVTKAYVTLDGFSWEQLNKASADVALLGQESVYYKEFNRMMDARELKDVALKADKNGVVKHIYVRVASVLSNAQFDAKVAAGEDVTDLLPGIQFAICDKTNKDLPENKFYLNAYTVNTGLVALVDDPDAVINYDVLLPLVNGDTQMVKLLPDSMIYALSDNPLDHLA